MKHRRLDNIIGRISPYSAQKMSSLVWPVPNWQYQYDYKSRPRSFGCPRDGGKRKHAGCDLYAPEGSSVRAITHGRVISEGIFYYEAREIAIDHGVLGVVRYCEIKTHKDIRVGQLVAPEQLIGYVTTMSGIPNTMLHIEHFLNQDVKLRGKKLSDKDYPNDFKRRGDLLDVTLLLDELRPKFIFPREYD